MARESYSAVGQSSVPDGVWGARRGVWRRTRSRAVGGVVLALEVLGGPRLGLASVAFAASVDTNVLDGNGGSVDCQLPVDILAGPVVNPENGHRYYLLPAASWPDSEAQAVCLGGHLVTINDKAEQNWVWETFSRYDGAERSLWIGLSDAASEGRFTWSSGEPVSYTHWADGAPDNCGRDPGEDHVHILPPWHGDAGYWNDDVLVPTAGCYRYVSNGVVENVRCGNGVLDPGEQCDDGNPNACDGCSPTCHHESGYRCGDAILSADCGEQCDDGNPVNGDRCENDCTLPRCGNGIVDPGEECDDGNLNPFDGCTAHCTICGDRLIMPPEECDDGNTNPTDGCTNGCTICGNGIVSAPEGCDDGNLVDGDGCAPERLSPGCGNGRVDTDEECDDGGLCIGAYAGTFCTAPPQCPGGTCQTFGGDSCAANCTRERELAFDLLPGQVQGQGPDIVAGTSGAVLWADILTIPLPFSGSQTLTIGKERDGQIPVIIKAASVHFTRISPVPTGACSCRRAVAAKTCGGTVVEPDGVTPSTDCTPGFTAGDSVCASNKPCAFVHGPGNSAAGVIGCDGLEGVNVHLTQDSGSPSGTPSPPLLTVSGTGGPGSAVVFATFAFANRVCFGSYGCGSLCTGQDASIYGPDGEFCTDDDPPDQRGTPVTALMTTGTATGQVLNANAIEGNNIGPFSVTGAPFRCSGPDTSGTALASTFTELAHPSLGDILYASVLVASGDAGACVGDCDAGGTVTANELVTLVSIALRNANVSACTAGDSKYDGRITIDEIIRAVNTALGGCPARVCGGIGGLPCPTGEVCDRRDPTCS